ncbi:anti-sigma factor domain-containing protein [Citricoccus sp. GCM10030269]|uniref:anti-sigma factor n=1 Tax=Citricoccus sp. GCM10030269 TaxID=3273388 RepID=UPI003607C7BA
MEEHSPGRPDRTTPPVEPSSTPSSTPTAADLGLPGLDHLLKLAGEGDRASFSAFYDATARWVYGLARAIFASEDDAAEATVLTYLRVWESASHEHFDDDSVASRHRSVLCWLEVLAHETMTRLVRTDALPEYGTGLLPEHAGVTDVEAHDPSTVLTELTPAQFAALELAWAGGRTYRQVAEELGVAVPTVKSRLRDAVQRVSKRYQEKFLGRASNDDPVMQRTVTPEIAARTGTTRNFTLNLSQDLENGLAKEWADLVALDALPEAEHEELNRFLAQQGPEFTTLWRARLEGARRTVTWAFRGLAHEPPSDLLDDLLHRLPAQDVGMGLMDGLAPSQSDDSAGRWGTRPVKKWMLVVAGLLVLAVGVWMVVRLILGPNVVATVDNAEDSFTTQHIALAEGGSMQGNVSKDNDMAYITFAGLPHPEDGSVYQLWLFPTDGSAPHSLGTYSLEDLEDPVTFRGVEQYEELAITTEPDGGSETPTSAPLGSVNLIHQVTQGPVYGGHPNSTPSPSDEESTEESTEE